MAGISALGTKFKMSTASSFAAGDEVGDLTNISGPTMSAEEIDVSSHDTTGDYREFASGFLDAGEMSLEGNLREDGGAEDLVDAFNDRKVRNFEVIFPTTGNLTWSFAGHVTGVETAAPYDDKASFSATVRITGKPTLA